MVVSYTGSDSKELDSDVCFIKSRTMRAFSLTNLLLSHHRETKRRILELDRSLLKMKVQLKSIEAIRTSQSQPGGLAQEPVLKTSCGEAYVAQENWCPTMSTLR